MLEKVRFRTDVKSMRYALYLFLLVIAANAITAQEAGVDAGSSLAVVKQSWARERLNWDDNENVTPGGVNIRPRPRTAPTTKAYRKKEASEQRSVRLASSGTREAPEDPQFQFTYTVTVRNDSTKTIREVDWDYVFLAETTREEIGRRQFTSEEKIEPGKTKKLSVQVSSPPTRRVDVQQAGKKEKTGLDESVVILRILYDDKTEWKAPTHN